MSRALRFGWVMVLLASQLLAQPAVPQYSVVALGVSRSLPRAINERGQVVGWFISPFPSLGFRPFLWGNGGMIDLGLLPGGDDSFVTGVNDRGQVVGYSDTTGCGGGCTHAFLWEQGSMIDLGGIGQDSQAYAINDLGQIVGASTMGSFPGPRTAVLWNGGAIVDLGTLPGDSSAAASGINNRGQIVGWSGYRAFIWENGILSELPGLSEPSAAYDINDRGLIIGASGGLPVVWENGTITVLNLPPGSWRVDSAGINERGQVVGTLVSTTLDDFRIAVLWQNGGVLVLPTLPPNRPAVALDINDRGEIVGTTAAGAVVWVPHDATSIR